MAIRGQAPTVLLLATETDSEWTGSSGRGGGVGGGDTSLDTSSGVGSAGGRDSNTSSSGSEGSEIGARSGGRSDDVGSEGEKGVDGDRGGGRPARPSSSSSSTAAASLNIVVDIDAGAAARAGSGSVTRASVGNARATDRGPVVGAPDEARPRARAPSAVRSPLPPSSFAAPSLADTEELHDHRRHQSGDAATGGGDDVQPGGGAAKEGDASAAFATNANSSDPRLSRRASTTRSRGGRTAAAVQPERGRSGGSRGVSITNEQPDGSKNAPDDANSTSEADDDSNGTFSDGGGGADSTRLGGSEEGDEVSGWGGLLDVDVRCSGSGNCPLHEAAASGSVGAVLSLLDLGADVSIVNGCGDTALHVSTGVLLC